MVFVLSYQTSFEPVVTTQAVCNPSLTNGENDLLNLIFDVICSTRSTLIPRKTDGSESRKETKLVALRDKKIKN